MNHNDIVIYGFNLGNSDPSFKEFVYSLSNYDVHNLRMILYKQLYKLEQNGVSAALHGRDSYGIIIVPEVRKTQLWAKSDKLLFNYIKDLWVASVLGFTDPGINPIKNHQWRITRIRAVTTRNEGWEVITAAVLEVGLAYIIQIGAIVYTGIRENAYQLKLLKTEGGRIDGFSISKGADYGTKPRFDFHTLYQPTKPSRFIPKILDKRRIFHYHRGSSNSQIRRHRPFEKRLSDTSFFDRF